jgi:biopolymer transport protein ExbD
LHIDLPVASPEAPPTETPALEIVVDPSGAYTLNGVSVENAAALAQRLRSIAVGGEQRVLVTADARASHQSVVGALSAAADAGLVRVGIATRHGDGSR